MPQQRWIRRAARRGSSTAARDSRSTRRLTLEPLEDRRLLAVLDVGAGARYATIQSAVDAARPGDVVLVGDGQYAESVDLSRMGIAGQQRLRWSGGLGDRVPGPGSSRIADPLGDQLGHQSPGLACEPSGPQRGGRIVCAAGNGRRIG